jgi:CRP/FNR family transcriptional regulator, cyclic AMP receptor protein
MLVAHALFRDLSRREMAALGARGPMRAVPVGQIVFNPLQPNPVIIKRGRIRLYRIAPDGCSVTTAVLGPGTVFGEMDLLGPHA